MRSRGLGSDAHANERSMIHEKSIHGYLKLNAKFFYPVPQGRSVGLGGGRET